MVLTLPILVSNPTPDCTGSFPSQTATFILTVIAKQSMEPLF